MSKTKKTQCETDQACETTQSKYTQVKTIYARAAVILLAVNFCLTGYVLMSVMDMQEETIQSETKPTRVGSTELEAAADATVREYNRRQMNKATVPGVVPGVIAPPAIPAAVPGFLGDPVDPAGNTEKEND